MPIAPPFFRTTACRAVALAFTAAFASGAALADAGKLVLTGGVSTIEGAAGGGLTPWAVIGTQATQGEKGVSVHTSRAVTDDYALNAYGAAVAIDERFELSVGRQEFRTGTTGDQLGLPGLQLKQDILGAKVRVAGDAVLDSDSLMPQIAVGV